MNPPPSGDQPAVSRGCHRHARRRGGLARRALPPDRRALGA